MRIVRRLVDGVWNPELARMETLWRDPATPTKAQAADAAVKLVQAGILPVEAAWEDLGYSSTRRAKLKALRDAQLADPLTEGLLNAAATSARPAAGPPASLVDPDATAEPPTAA